MIVNDYKIGHTPAALTEIVFTQNYLIIDECPPKLQEYLTDSKISKNIVQDEIVQHLGFEIVFVSLML